MHRHSLHRSQNDLELWFDVDLCSQAGIDYTRIESDHASQTSVVGGPTEKYSCRYPAAPNEDGGDAGRSRIEGPGRTTTESGDGSCRCETRGSIRLYYASVCC